VAEVTIAIAFVIGFILATWAMYLFVEVALLESRG